MSNKTSLKLYAASLGWLTTGFALWSVRGLLPDITVKIGLALMVVGAVYVAYLAHRLYTKFRVNHLELARKQEELERERQTRQIEAERWHVERSALLLAQQLQVSRIYPDAKGYMPTIVTLDQVQGTVQYLQLPHANARQQYALPSSASASIEQHAEHLSDLPTTVRYDDIRSQIPHGHTLLGVSTQGIETKEFGALKTMLISGGSDSGKSNTLALKIDEAMRLGNNTGMIVIDWHAYKPDSLTNKIKCYERRFLLPVVTEEEDTVPVLNHFLEEYKQRRKEMKEAAEQGLEASFDDILLVCDEVPEMLDSGIPELKETLTQVAKICGRSARGFGLFGWFVCQNMIGAASIRNYAHTIIGHKAVMLSEQKMVANGHTDIMRDMDSWPRGRVVVYGQSFTGTQVLQMPMFTPSGPEEQMEALQPRTSSKRTVRRPAIIVDADEENSPKETDFCRQEHETAENITYLDQTRTSEKNSISELADGLDFQSENSPAYRFSEEEIKQFIAAYKVSGNIERCLVSMRKGSRYKAHAREIIQAYSLRRA